MKTSYFVIVAPPTTPSPNIHSFSPTSITIAWNEIPCLERNGVISRYIFSICQVTDSGCVGTSIANVGTNRIYNVTQLIPRTSYNISIRADSEDSTFMAFTGSFSSPISAETAVPEGQ